LLAATRLEELFARHRNANRSRKVKKRLCLVFGALTGITIPQSSALAETGTPNSTAAAPTSSSAPLKTNGQSSKTVVEDCEAEWRADREAMMKRDLTEDRYVEQCSVKDDVPTIPSETKTNAAPSSAPK
jgi:hypothetical protein